MSIPFVPVAPGLCNLAPTIGYAGALRYLFDDGTDLSGIDTVEVYGTSGDPITLGFSVGSVSITDLSGVPDGDYEYLLLTWTATQATAFAELVEPRWHATDGDSVPWLAGRVYPTVEGEGGAGDGSTTLVAVPGIDAVQTVYVQGVGVPGADGAGGGGAWGSIGGTLGDQADLAAALAGKLAPGDEGWIVNLAGDPSVGFGGSYAADVWTIDALAAQPAGLELAVWVGDDPLDSASGSGIFTHDGSGGFDRTHTFVVADAGKYVAPSSVPANTVYRLQTPDGVSLNVFAPGGAVESVNAGYGLEVDQSTGAVTVSKKKVRPVPYIKAFWNGDGTTPMQGYRAGDPTGVRLPTAGVVASGIDGWALEGPTVIGVAGTTAGAGADPDTFDNGFWEVFEVQENGAGNAYYEVDDFADPKPSAGDTYFHATTELNGLWIEDSLPVGTPVHVAEGDIFGGRESVSTASDGLRCNFGPHVIPTSRVIGGAFDGNLAGVSEADLEAILQAIDNLDLGGGSGGGGVAAALSPPLVDGSYIGSQMTNWSQTTLTSTVMGACQITVASPVPVGADVEIDRFEIRPQVAATDPGAVFLVGACPATPYGTPDFASMVGETSFDATTTGQAFSAITPEELAAGLWFFCIGLKSTTSKAGTNPELRSSAPDGWPLTNRGIGGGAFDNTVGVVQGTRAEDADLSTSTVQMSNRSIGFTLPIILARISDLP